MAQNQSIISDGVSSQVIVKSGTYTVTDRFQTIVVNCTGPVEIILPTAQGREGFNVEITRIDNTLHNLTVHGVDFQKINNATNFYINAQGMTVCFTAVNTSTNDTPIPAYYIRNIHEPLVVKEDFSLLLDFNREKICYHTASSNFTYAASTRPKRHGIVISHRVDSQSGAMASFPPSWMVHGEFKPNVSNYLTFVALPDMASETDAIHVTIRQKTV